MSDPSHLVAERVARAWEHPSEEALQAALMAVIDTVSVAGAAYRLEPVAREFASRVARGSGGTIVLGSWRGTGLLSGTAANAFLAHAIELDDWLRKGYVHAGTVVVPAALAAAQLSGSTLGEMLRAVAAGYEAAGLAGAFLGRHHYRVYHSTATAGAVGAAASYALLSGHGPGDALAPAMRIALAYAGGLWSAPRDPRVKPLSASQASTLGIESALAAASSGAPGPGIEESCRALRGECNADMLRGPPWRWAVEDNGYKLYPTCRHTHTAIHAALSIREELARRGDTAESIRGVTVETYSDAVRVASRWPLRDRYEARFSIELLVAYSLTRGPPSISGLARAIRDMLVARIAGLVRVVPAEWADREYPERMPARVTVRTGTGTSSSTVLVPPGDPGTVGLNDILAKARSLSLEAGDTIIAGLAERLAGANPNIPVNILVNRLLTEHGDAI